MSSQAEKKGRAFDKTIDEWKRRVADLQSEMENSQRESRTNAAEVYKLRTQMEEQNDSMEALRRENKNLSGKYFKVQFMHLSLHLIYEHSVYVGLILSK